MGKRFFSFALALALCLGLAFPAAASYTTVTAGEYTTISCGSQHMAAIDTDGALWIWGDNYDAQLGNGKQGSEYSSNVPIKVMEDVVSVSCGDRNTAAITSDGTLWMWGYNKFGQVGNDRAGDLKQGEGYYQQIYQTVPAKVMEDVAAVSCGNGITAAIKKDGSLWIWGITGDSLCNQIVGSTRCQTVPVKVMDDVASIESILSVVKTDGSLWARGWGPYYVDETATEHSSDFVKLTDDVVTTSGSSARAVIKKDGSLWMWGLNSDGQLGNGRVGDEYHEYAPTLTTVSQTTPVKVMDQVASVLSIDTQTAVIKEDGSLWMWGRNDYGQLGNGASKNKYSIISSEECSYFPVKVMDHVVAFDCGRYNTIALKTDGTVWAWGYNRYGQVGNGGVGDARPNYNYGDRCQTLPVKVMDNIRLPDAKPVPTVGGFRDVHENDYFADPVLWAVDNNVTSGTGDGKFSPDATCNRAQVLSFLWRASGFPDPTVSNPFSDVKATDYYCKAALWAAEKGMVSGSVFGAGTPCTRASAMEYMWKAAGSPKAPYDGKFSDVAAGSEYAQAVAWALNNNVTAGTSATQFSPNNTCTRGQIVTFLYRAFGK